MNLPFHVDRDIVICASRSTVFGFFTDSERWARWWGAGSRVDPRPGGELLIVYPGGARAEGVVELVQPVERFVFTYGYDRPNTPIAPGGSRVTITLTEVAGGTRVQLVHDVATEAIRDQHVGGWRYQMAVFGDVVTRESAAGATATLDRYFTAWGERDELLRREALAATCSDDVVYRDKFGYTTDRDDLDGHIAAAQQHMPAVLARDGEPRVSLGMAVVDWTATPSGATAPASRGTSVIELAPDGRIARVTGFWR